MRTIFDPQERDALLRRIDALAPDRPASWGRMDAPRMVGHLTCALQAGLGELAVGPAQGPLSHPPLNWLAIYVLPWPPGKADSPPEFLGRAASTWTADVSLLRSLLERSGARGPGAPWPPSRVFGRISGQAWGVLHRKHLDHHLRQFGV
jgi:hypothetical protein